MVVVCATQIMITKFCEQSIEHLTTVCCLKPFLLKLTHMQDALMSTGDEFLLNSIRCNVFVPKQIM